MKKLTIIFIGIMHISSILFAQIEERISLFDNGASSSGYTMIKDEFWSSQLNVGTGLFDFHNVMAYTTYAGGNSEIRIASVNSVTKTVKYDVAFRIGVNPTVTSIVYDDAKSCNVITGFCKPFGETIMFIAQFNEVTGAYINHKLYSFGTPGFYHTFSIDMIRTQNPVGNSYICVGYTADGPDASASLKRPFVVSFNQNSLNLDWFKIHPSLLGDVHDVFNSITNTAAGEFAVGGMLQKDPTMQGNTTRWLMTVLKFNYAGNELDRRLFITHPVNLTPNWSQNDQPFMSDLLYSGNNLYVLSFNDENETINIDQIDYASFNNLSAISIWMPNTLFSVQALGSKILDLGGNKFGIVGYSNKILMNVEREILLTTLDLVPGTGVLPVIPSTPVTLFPIINTNFNAVNPNLHFNTLSIFSHAPHAFLPSNAVFEPTGPTSGNFYIACNKLSANTKLYPTIIGHDEATFSAYTCEKNLENGEIKNETPGYFNSPEITSYTDMDYRGQVYEGLIHLPTIVYDCSGSFKTTDLSSVSNYKANIHLSSHYLEFHCNSTSTYDIESICIFDLTGRKLPFHFSEMTNDQINLKLEDNAEGVKILKIKNVNGEIESFKFASK